MGLAAGGLAAGAGHGRMLMWSLAIGAEDGWDVLRRQGHSKPRVLLFRPLALTAGLPLTSWASDYLETVTGPVSGCVPEGIDLCQLNYAGRKAAGDGEALLPAAVATHQGAPDSTNVTKIWGPGRPQVPSRRLQAKYWMPPGSRRSTHGSYRREPSPHLSQHVPRQADRYSPVDDRPGAAAFSTNA